jgi:hypothetical protein
VSIIDQQAAKGLQRFDQSQVVADAGGIGR